MKHLVGMIIFFEFLMPSVLAQDVARPATRQWTTMENYASEQFFDHGALGSIILKGTCKDELPGDAIATERISRPSTGSFKNIDDALNALTLLDQHVSWIRESNGMVRLRDDRVTAPLLSLGLRKVSVRSKIDPESAIDALMKNPNVVSFLKENRIQLGITFSGNLSRQNWRRSPSVTKELENVSVGDALDQIVSMQHGIWIYDDCLIETGERISIRFAAVK